MSDLNLQVSANAQKAQSALAKLTSALTNLGTVLASFNSSNIATTFDNISNGVNQLADSVNGLDVDKIKAMSEGLKTLGTATNSLSKASERLTSFGEKETAVQNTTRQIATELAGAFGKSTKTQIDNIAEAMGRFIDESGNINWDGLVDNGTEGLNSVASAIRNNVTYMGNLTEESKKLLEYMRQFNASGHKVSLPKGMASEFSDDYKALRATLGKGFGIDNGGISLEQFVTGLNENLGQTVPLCNNTADTFARLVEVLKVAREQARGIEGKSFYSGTENLQKIALVAMDAYEKLYKEQQAMRGVADATQQVPPINNITELAEQLRSMQDLNFNGGKELAELASAISKLGSAQVAKACDNIPRLTEALNKMLEKLSKAPQVSANTIQMVQAMGSLSAHSIRVGNTLPKVGSSLDKLQAPILRSQKNFKGLASVFGMFYAKCFLLIRAIKGMWASVTDAMGTIEVYNYFNKSFSEVAKSATDVDWATLGEEGAKEYIDGYTQQAKDLTKKMSGYEVDTQGNLWNSGAVSLGINPKDLMNYQAQFAQMSNSMGVSSDNAMKLSTAMSQLGADLASIKNMDFTDVWDNLSSGMVGMSRAVDKYGINIREAAMNEKLANLGIDTTVKKLDAEQKALLRAIIMLDSSRGAWGDLADTLDQPANQLRMLKSSWENLCRTMGSMFLGTVSQILPYINALVKALQNLCEWIITTFGIKLVSVTSESSGNMENLTDSIYGTDDALGDATDSAKKLKNNLLGIDELNVISKEDNASSTSGTKGYTGDELQNAFDDLYNQYQKAWEDAFNGIENKVSEFLNKILEAIKNGDWFKVGSLLSDALKDLFDIDWDSIFDWSYDFGGNLAKFLNGLLDPEMGYLLGEGLINIVNTGFQMLAGFVDEFDFTNLGLFFGNFLNGIIDNWDNTLFATTVAGLINGAFDTLTALFDTVKFEELGKKITSALQLTFEELDFSKISSTLSSALTGILDFSTGLLEGVNFETLPSDIVDAICEFIDGLDVLSIVDAFTRFIDRLTTSLWELEFVGIPTAIIHLLTGEDAEDVAAKIEEYTNPIKDKYVGKFTEIKDSILEKIDEFKTEIPNKFNELKTEFENSQFASDLKGVFEGVQKAIQPLINTFLLLVAVVKHYINVAKSMGESLKEIIGIVKDEFAPAFENAKTAISTSLAYVKAIILSVFTIFSNVVQLIGNLMSGDFTAAWENAKTIVRNAFLIIQLTVFNIFEGIKNIITTGMAFISGIISSVLLVIRALWEAGWNVLKTTVDTVWNTIKKIVSLAIKAVNTTITTVMGFIESGIGTALDNIKSKWDSTWEGMKTGIVGIVNGILSIVQALADGVVDAINSVIDAINEVTSFSLPSWLPSELAGKSFGINLQKLEYVKIPTIPTYEVGGFPDKGMFMMNEGDSAEMLGTINGKTAVVNNDQIVSAVADGVSMAVSEAMIPYLSQIANNTKETADKDFSVNIGDRDIARANIRGSRLLGRQIASTV